MKLVRDRRNDFKGISGGGDDYNNNNNKNAFHTLGPVVCYDLVPAFEVSSQRSWSFSLVTNLECDS
jgi:hypothetical protein